MRALYTKPSHLSASPAPVRVDNEMAPSVCMLVLSPARLDPRVQRIAQTLANSSLRVTVVDVEQGRDRPTKEARGAVAVKHIRLPTRFSPYYHSNMAFVPWLLFKALRILLASWTVLWTRADVYHAVDLIALPSCYLAALLHRKTLVFEAHELPLAEPSVTGRPLLRGISTWLCRRLVARCAGVITVSPPIVETIQQRFGGPRAALVRNIPLYYAPAQNNRIRARLGLDHNTRIALFQGHMRAERSLDTLILAARYLRGDTIIVLLGGGESQGELQRLIVDEGVADRVKMLPAVPYAELLDWTASADLGLMVSQPTFSANTEMSLPNKLFEYLMAGLPVLSSQLRAMTDLLCHYDVGRTLDSLEPKAVAHAIDDMLDDTVGLAQMRKNALTACQRELCWEVEGQSLLQFYQDLLPSAHLDIVSQ